MLVDFVQWLPPRSRRLLVARGRAYAFDIRRGKLHRRARARHEGTIRINIGAPCSPGNRVRARCSMKAARAAGWGKPLPETRRARHHRAESRSAASWSVVVEAGVGRGGEVVLRRIVAAVDSGLTVNPNLMKQQVEGGILFGLSPPLYSEITIRRRARSAIQLQRLPDAAPE